MIRILVIITLFLFNYPCLAKVGEMYGCEFLDGYEQKSDKENLTKGSPYDFKKKWSFYWWRDSIEIVDGETYEMINQNSPKSFIALNQDKETFSILNYRDITNILVTQGDNGLVSYLYIYKCLSLPSN